MAKFFAIPFAASASKSTIPDSDTSNVSWNSGYTVNYEYNPLTNKQAKHIERDVMNSLFYEITSTIQQLQLNGVAPYYEAIITANGPGYSEGAIVSYGGKLWRSKIASNKVIPNANSTKNWEQIYGYDTLKAQLSKDGIGGGSGGSTDGYSKEEINQIINNLNTSLFTALDEYLHKEEGEIYFLSWADEDRNDQGFFLCNGDKFPYIPDGEVDDGSNPLTFYGNKLYNLCYGTDSTGTTIVETNFKKRWNIQINKTDKTVQLPNILGLRSDDSIASETDIVLLSLSKKASIPDLTIKSRGLANSGGENVFLFKMLPCVYLGLKPIEDADGGTK